MSRSYRRPYAAVTGTASAKQDKVLAHRGVRRAQNAALRLAADFEELLLPHKLECHWNDPYSWGRDGKQRLQTLPIWGSSVTRYWSSIHPDRAAKWFENDVRNYERLFRK